MANYVMQNSGQDLDNTVTAYKNGTIAKAKVGLGNVDNTSDLNKPISNAAQTALNAKADKQNANGGFSAGENAVTTRGGSIGKNANSEYGGSVGYGATSTSGGAIGDNATATSGGAVGELSMANAGCAVGAGAATSDGAACGNAAVCVDADGTPIDAIQLGTGTNNTPKTMQVYDYPLLDANGNIPAERLANAPKTDKENQSGGFNAGKDTYSETGGAIGNNAYSMGGGSVGYNTYSNQGGAVGEGAETDNGFAGGYNAKTTATGENGDYQIDAIQLGSGVNNMPKTMQVYNKRIVEADGSLTDVGKLSDLNTTAKTSIVSAVNEAFNKGSGLQEIDMGSCSNDFITAAGTALQNIYEGVYKITGTFENSGELDTKTGIAVCSYDNAGGDVSSQFLFTVDGEYRRLVDGIPVRPFKRIIYAEREYTTQYMNVEIPASEQCAVLSWTGLNTTYGDYFMIPKINSSVDVSGNYVPVGVSINQSIDLDTNNIYVYRIPGADTSKKVSVSIGLMFIKGSVV